MDHFSVLNGVEQEPKTYSIAQNNLSSESVMITIQKPIFCFRANPFLFYMKKLRAIKQRPTTQFFLAGLCKAKNDQDRENVSLRKPLTS
ncbi:hypothetical protein TYRP_010194 [Tyrophagus putrescentiae]|nr:hypothetical protein TYRP_010194 [Tyrophagus putrescentiae]